MKKDGIRLHIDTSKEREVTISLWKHDAMIGEMTKRQDHSSEVTLVLIMEIVKDHALTLDDIGTITVFPGPGSYTGLRVGAAIGVALGNLLGIPVNGTNVPSSITLRYGDDRWAS